MSECEYRFIIVNLEQQVTRLEEEVAKLKRFLGLRY